MVSSQQNLLLYVLACCWTSRENLLVLGGAQNGKSFHPCGFHLLLDPGWGLALRGRTVWVKRERDKVKLCRGECNKLRHGSCWHLPTFKLGWCSCSCCWLIFWLHHAERKKKRACYPLAVTSSFGCICITRKWVLVVTRNRTCEGAYHLNDTRGHDAIVTMSLGTQV